MINASLVSAQNRKRLFWANFPITQPLDKGIILKDILESGDTILDRSMIGFEGKPRVYDKGKCPPITARIYKEPYQVTSTIRIGSIGKGGQADRIYSPEGKSVSLSANGGGRGAKTGLYMIGNVYPKKGQNGNVYHPNGKAPTLSALEVELSVEALAQVMLLKLERL